MNEEDMSDLYDPYDIPIKAVSIDKRKYSKNEIHEILVSQSSDLHFSLLDSINGGQYATNIDIPPEKLEILKFYVDKAVENYKNKKMKNLPNG